MVLPRKRSLLRALSVFSGSIVLLLIALALPGRNAAGHRAIPPEPWTAAQTVQPAALAAELKEEKERPPKVVCVGFRTLYRGAHVPGAVFHGPGSSQQGLADLKQYAGTLPKNSNVVLYCGCCPLERCPNIRPAFSALQGMGFTHLRVLILPTSFAADWIDKGYPVEKSLPGSQ